MWTVSCADPPLLLRVWSGEITPFLVGRNVPRVRCAQLEERVEERERSAHPLSRVHVCWMRRSERYRGRWGAAEDLLPLPVDAAAALTAAHFIYRGVGWGWRPYYNPACYRAGLAVEQESFSCCFFNYISAVSHLLKQNFNSKFMFNNPFVCIIING